MTLDDELREALQAEADEARPSPDGWERLQERVGSAKGRRTRVWLPVLAAAVVVLAAVGAWQLASDDDDLRVNTGGETSTTIGTTAAPTPSTSIAPSTTAVTVPPTAPPATATPTAPPGAATTTIVAVTDDGRLVVLDAATGAELRELANLGDPRGGGAEGPGPNHVTTVSVSPDGSTAYYDSCCEPAAGLVSVIPTDGTREAEAINPGLGPTVSPDGRFLAYTAINAVVVRDLTTGQEQVFTEPAYDESPLFGEVTWSRDGTKLYYAWERQGAVSTDAIASLVELTVTPGATPRVLTEVPGAAMTNPLAWDDGRTVSVLLRPLQPDGSAGPQDGELLVDSTTGEVTQTTVNGVLDRSVNRTSGEQLIVRSDGHLIVGAADLGPGYAVAAW
jgi:hypothetical protein